MKKTILSAIFGGLIGIVLVLLFLKFADKELINKLTPKHSSNLFIYLILVVSGLFSSLIVHELGHLITGLLLGNKFQLFIVGLLGVKNENEKIKIFLNKDFGLFGGIASTTPKNNSIDNFKNFELILIAGPIFSIAYFAITAILFLVLDTKFSPFFGLASITSFGIFLATTVPEKTGLMFTDRKRFQRLRQKGITQDAEFALITTITQIQLNNSFRDIDISKTDIIERDNEMIMKFWANYIRFQYYKEIGDKSKEEYFRNSLNKFQEEFPKQLWKTLKIE